VAFRRCRKRNHQNTQSSEDLKIFQRLNPPIINFQQIKKCLKKY
jgi:hypothetical protein